MNVRSNQQLASAVAKEFRFMRSRGAAHLTHAMDKIVPWVDDSTLLYKELYCKAQMIIHNRQARSDRK